MSNLRNNNVYFTCPALMADGRDSINTDYRPKNDAFKILRGNMNNSYQFRDDLQSKLGYEKIAKNSNNYTLCNPVPFGTDTFPKNPIHLGINTNSSFKDAFTTLKLYDLSSDMNKSNVVNN